MDQQTQEDPSPSLEGGNPNNNTNIHQRRRKRQQRVSSSNNFHGSKFDLRHDYQHGANTNHRDCDGSNDASCGINAANGNGNGSGTATATGASRSQQGQQKRGRRRRRFWNDAGSSDSGDPSYNQYSPSSSNNSNDGNNYNRNCRRTRKMAKATSSSSDGGSASWITKKKQRQPNDDSLLGKTGVSALYEWCMKRRTTPTFSMTPSADDNNNNNNNNKNDAEHSENETQQQHQEDIETQQQQQPHIPKGEEGKRRRLELEHDFFETTVSIDGIEMGTGRGRTKTSAKHEASRRALLTLLPGVVFDEDSGILIRLPGNYHSQGTSTSHGRMQQQRIAAITSMEDLAPNLAKQLAIGHSNDDEISLEHKKQRERNNTIDDELTAARDSRKRQKWPHVYPGTSTTSDDEDENSYYASRGAYVCSSLLHAMVQIDERLTEPPEFTYQVSAITNETGGQHSKLKRKAGVPINATSTAIPRGSFQCTGILKLQIDSNSPCSKDNNVPVEALDETPEPRDCYRLLRSSGVGGTKREARHTAAAKLLAMLFPECDGMADVKQAAETAREKYAASRALKQQSKREALFTGSSRSKGNNHFSSIHFNDSIARNLMFRRVLANTPVVPTIMKFDFLHALGGLSPKSSYEEDSSGYGYKGNGISTLEATGLVRQLSRQQQLEEKIEWALQKLNEHDDEGRSLPEELTADDVGRTVLRRARVDDVFWVEKLFRTKTSPTPTSACDSSPLFETILDPDKEASSMSMQLWSSSTIVLLLCRAIAPHEDPPLGCAVLTVGFSLQKGKTLRIAQIASKSHQPRERFIETLFVFAKNMECSLITSPSKSSFATLDTGGVQRLLDPQSDPREYPLRQDGSQKSKTVLDDLDLPLVPPLREESLGKPSLQAVEEEGEGVEESDSSSPNDEKDKRREKPSKRSRFE